MSANERQEGGSHYKQEKGVPEHWDLAIMYDWDLFQYQITKYVMRWKDKYDTPAKRLVDLKKAMHFLEKYIENWELYDKQRKDAISAAPPEIAYAVPHQGEDSDANWSNEGYYGDMSCLYKCRHCKKYLRAKNTIEAQRLHPECMAAIVSPLA